METQKSPVQEICTSQLGLSSSEPQEGITAQAQKQCILIHGWNSTGNDMLRIRDAIMKLPNAQNYRFWWVTYDTNASFKWNAEQIIKLYNSQGVDFSNALIVGYSMGGVVARSMFDQGFQFRKLVTICTPHEGLAWWIPTPTSGTMSIAPWSDDLKKLNQSSRDISKRNDYYFYGITYTDIRGNHEDDAVVEIGSACGSSLSGNITRGRIPLTYNGGFAGTDPHSRGMDPNQLHLMLDQIARLL